jgi:ketosteroid isomerase-like protein
MTPKEVLIAFHAAFVARDVDGLCALYADDAINHQVAEAPLHGKAAIRKSFEDFFRAFPDETTEMLNLFQDGEWAIWEWRGGFAQMPTGAPVLHGCGFFHVRNGLIVFQRGYWDKLTFLRMHGLPLPR